MIRFSVFYPVTEGATFDHAYYAEKHVPLARASHFALLERPDAVLPAMERFYTELARRTPPRPARSAATHAS